VQPSKCTEDREEDLDGHPDTSGGQEGRFIRTTSTILYKKEVVFRLPPSNILEDSAEFP
jgi:hypothetical protein